MSEKIFEVFGFEKVYEDETEMILRTLIGFDFKSNGKLRLFSPDRNNHIITFSIFKNEQISNKKMIYKIVFKKPKTMFLTKILVKNLESYLKLTRMETIKLIDSGVLEFEDYLEYRFMVNYLLSLSCDVEF